MGRQQFVILFHTLQSSDLNSKCTVYNFSTLQNLTADIVYNRPPDPIDYMIAEIEVIKKNRDLVETEAKPPQNTSNVSQDV